MSRDTYSEISYVELISKYYPLVYVKALGYGEVYGDLVHIGGDPIPSQEDLDSKRLVFKQGVVWERIKNMRDSLEDSGVAINIGGTIYWYHSDVKSLIKYAFLTLLVIIAPANFPVSLHWKTMTGEKVLMNITIVLAIFNSFLSAGSIIYEIAETHRQAMLLEPDPYNYDFTTGWPAVYGS